MADNPYGDAETSGEGRSNDRPPHRTKPSLCDELEQMISAHSVQLQDLMRKLKREKEATEKLLKQKEEENQKLRDEVQLLKRKIEGTKPKEVIYSRTLSSGTGQMRTKNPLFKGMDESDTINTFIDKKIRPNKQFNKQCLEIIDKLVRSLQAKNSPFNIKGIVKSGSLGKGTAVKDKSDIDLIIFFNGYSSVTDLQKDKDRLLLELKAFVQRDWADHLLFKDKTPFSVQFYLKIQKEDSEHEVDLLPALDITKSRSLPDIYSEMKSLSRTDRDAYSSCFSQLQLDFVTATDRVSTPGKVKDLIRLLKYWIKEEEVPVRSYFLELLVVYLWREDGKPANIDTEKYLHKVLTMLVDCKNLAITFPDNYKYEDYRPEIEKPFLLDPANPFRNVAPFPKREVETVKRRAQTVLERGWTSL